MKKVKFLFTAVATFLLVCVAGVSAEEYSTIYQNLTSNGKITVSFMNDNPREWIINDHLSTFITDDYSFYIESCNDDFTMCSIGLIYNDLSVEDEYHNIQISYKEVYSDEFKSILTNGKLVVKDSDLDADKTSVIRNSISKFNSDMYSFNVDSCNNDYTNCRISQYYAVGGFEQHDVDVTYKEEYSENFKKIISNGKIVITSSTVGEKKDLVWSYINSFWSSDLSFNVSSCNDDATKCAISMNQSNPYKMEVHVMDIVYEEKYSEAFKNVITDGKIVVNSIQPKNSEQADFFLQNYLNNISTSSREYWSGICNDDYTICDIAVSIRNEDDSYTIESHKANITYAKIDTNKQAQVNKILASIPENKTFVIEDLEIINYIVNSGYINDDNYSAVNTFINYSSELKKLLGNSNITASLDVRAGTMPVFVCENLGGYVVAYDGISYGLFQGGAIRKNVIYIPNETEETQEAYVKAAQDRINNYLGNNKVKIVYAGKLSELEYSDHEELGYGDKLRDEYYTLTYQDVDFNFLIIKDSSKMKVIEEQSTSDVMTNISISMNSSSLPLDTSIMVDEIQKDSQKYKEITNKLTEYNTDNALVYDLKLYSSSNRDYITKLDNGLFEVKIPVSKELEGKDLIVYYVSENGKVEEHEVTVKDGYATFTTNHFSIYTLAEKKATSSGEGETEIENPNTYDDILTYCVIGLISLVTLCMLGLYSNKLNNRKDY